MPEVGLDEEIQDRLDRKISPLTIQIALNNSVNAKLASNVFYTRPHDPVLRGVQLPVSELLYFHAILDMVEYPSGPTI